MNYNFITLGFNCSPAIILKDLGLRNYSLPFDWILTNNIQIIHCIEDDFKKFHKNLQFTLNNHWFIDEYGIQYPHDYPVNDDGTIINNWQNYHIEVLEKYERRIQRFKDIMNSSIPIIALYYGPYRYAVFMKKYMEQKYNKTIIFVVTTIEVFINNNDDNIILCIVSNNEQSRNKDYWVHGINQAFSKINIPSPLPESKKINKMFMKLF